jgi:hypothetical protein
MNKQALFITQTAVMLALLFGAQLVTRAFGQFVTGSIVNMILLICTFLVGTGGGLIVAVISPILAFSVGMGPAFIQIVPFIAAGNAILVIFAQFGRKYVAVGGKKESLIAAVFLAAAGLAKTLFLWIGLVIIVLPMIPGLKEQQVAIIGAAFTWPQFVTAMIGGALAMLIVPPLKKALAKQKLVH